MLKDILKILENDARTTTRQIATMTGTPVAEVTRLIKQAEKDKLILKYKTIVNWDRIENDQVWAIIGHAGAGGGFRLHSRAYCTIRAGTLTLPCLGHVRPAAGRYG